MGRANVSTHPNKKLASATTDVFFPLQLCVWSSTMRRARQTAEGIEKSRYVEWRALREIEVGVCDGMTYAQVTGPFAG